MSEWRRALAEKIGGIPTQVFAKLLAEMDGADRLALARELLAGTGWVVARKVHESGSDNGVRIPDAPDWATTGSERGSWEMGWSEGWNACRAAMLGDKP